MIQKTDLHRVEDMIVAGERAIRHLGRLDLPGLMADELRSDAVVRTLEIVGEACKHVSQPTRDRFPAVPWKAIAGMRDRLTHGYDDVSWQRVWETLTLQLPPTLTELKSALQVLVAEEAAPQQESD
jgi:uncharacterized protein with HEPN domain